jgi:hypothetical protein
MQLSEKLQQLQLLTEEQQKLRLKAAVLEAAVCGREHHVSAVAGTRGRVRSSVLRSKIQQPAHIYSLLLCMTPSYLKPAATAFEPVSTCITTLANPALAAATFHQLTLYCCCTLMDCCCSSSC